MTLAEIASHVCEVVGTTDAESIALAKTFVQRRYSLIWDAHPWRETLDVATATVTTGYRNAVFTNAPDLERVLVCVSDDNVGLEPIEWANLWAFDRAAFAATGGAAHGFSICRRTPLIFGNDRGHALAYAYAPSSTVAVTVTARGRTAGGELATTYATLAAGSGTEANFATEENNPYYELELAEVHSIETSVDDWTDSNVGLNLATAGGLVVVRYVAPGKTVHDTYAQIRLSRAATATTTIRALGKLKCNTLADAETPRIDNVTEALINLSQADMLERQRQYSKAAIKNQAGGALVNGLLLDLQRRQTADGTQIVPCIEPGYFSGAGNSKGYW